MAIKLPDTTAGLLQQVQQSRAERLSMLGQLMVQGVGRTPVTSTEAQVQSVAPVTSEQRQQLFNRLFSALAQLEAKPETPVKLQQLGQLAQERALLNSPLLKLVRLEIHQKPITTFTDRPLNTGDSVRVYLNENRLWQLASQPAATPNAASTQRQGPASLELGASLTLQNQQDSKALQALLAQALRTALPLKDKPDLGPALPQIQQLPLRQQRELFSSELQQALQRAAQQLRQPTQLTDAKALRQALTEGGAQLENKLARVINLGRTLDPQARAGRTDGESVNRVLSGDWKASLLTVLHQVRADLSRLGQAPDIRPGAPEVSLSQLLAQISARPQAELNERTQRIQLLQLLHQSTLHSLARVQMQQLHGLSHQQAQADTGQATQSLALEIPMRLGHEVQTLHLRIDEQWQEEQEETTRAAGKTRQWQVLLSFELPEAGPMHAQITVRDQQVATRIWAERSDTAENIRARLAQLQQRLEKDGIEVTALECHLGAPAQRKTRLHYSLVDIKT